MEDRREFYLGDHGRGIIKTRRVYSSCDMVMMMSGITIVSEV